MYPNLISDHINQDILLNWISFLPNLLFPAGFIQETVTFCLISFHTLKSGWVAISAQLILSLWHVGNKPQAHRHTDKYSLGMTGHFSPKHKHSNHMNQQMKGMPESGGIAHTQPCRMLTGTVYRKTEDFFFYFTKEFLAGCLCASVYVFCMGGSQTTGAEKIKELQKSDMNLD